MLTPGQQVGLTGDITRLNAIAGRAPADIEAMIGYGAGRLAQGYWIALLKEALRANHIRFAGLTLRSGGRAGLPSHDPAADKTRTHIHDSMMTDYGADGVAKLLARLANDPRNLSGSERIAKVIPLTRHQGNDPAQEYPPGGGAPQFTLTNPHLFLIAAEVNGSGVVTTAAGWSVSVAPGAAYDDRAKLARYLAAA